MYDFAFIWMWTKNQYISSNRRFISFGSSVKEAGKLLGINLLDISPTISENSEQLEVYQLPGTWMIGEGEAEVSLHF